MNKNTKRVLSAITTASLAGVLGGVAPAVAPSVLNLNGGVVHAAEETHKVTIHYDFYDDPMSPFSSSSSSKVVDVTPNQPLSDHIPETFPGGYVFAGAVVNRGGSEGTSLNSRNDLFGDWTNFYVTYPRRSNGSRTNPSNAGTNNNEKPHKVTIHYSLYNGYHPVPSPSSEVFYVTPNQPLSDHIPETLPGGYVFTGASAFVEGSEGVTLSSRNDLFGNETTFYARYLPKSKISGTNPSNAGTNNNAGTEVKPNNGNTNSGNNNSNVATPESKISPSDNIINNIFSNDAFGVKVTLTDKTTAAKLSATPVEDKALANSVLEKLNLPADNQIRILDLKLLDKNNNVVDSKAKRTVAIVLKEGEKDVAIYHIKDNGELKLIDSTTKDGVVTFEIDHFSKFAIVSNANKPSNSPSKVTQPNTSASLNKLLPKTGLTNSNLASLVTLSLLVSGVAIFARRKNRR